MDVHVVVNLDLGEVAVDRYSQYFKTHFPNLQVDIICHRSELMRFVDTVDVLMTYGSTMGPEAETFAARAKRLQWIQVLGTGVDNIVGLPFFRPDVVVTSMHGIHGTSMSETALFLMMALSRNFPQTVRNQDNHIWDRWPSRLLSGKTLAILGVGAIAESLAPRCAALGMTVVGISSAPRNLPGFNRMVAKDRLRDVAAECDYLLLLTPSTPQTRGIINAELLEAMKPTAYLVNIGRGDLVDEQALLRALTTKRIAGAALDAFAEEPLSADHPYWAMQNVIVTPHVGACNEESEDNQLAIIDRNLRAFLANDFERMTNLVKRRERKSELQLGARHA